MEYSKIKKLCRSLCRKQTQSEIPFWNEFRNRKFNRQFPIIYETINTNEHFFFVADFYCFENKLVVELDGAIHNFQKEKDFNRDKVIEGLGLKVLRIKNEELENLEMVKQKILNSIKEK